MIDISMRDDPYQKMSPDIVALVDKIKQLGQLVTLQLSEVLELLKDDSTTRYQSILDREKEIDYSEIDIDKDCERIIALQQPAASSLRLVLAISRTVCNLERIGDELKQVADMLMDIHRQSTRRIGLKSIKHIGDGISSSLQQVLNAFYDADVQQALPMARPEEGIEDALRSLSREMVTYMIEDPSCISHVLNVLRAVHSLERIGGHISNIAEQLIYAGEGVEARHRSLKELNQRIDQN